MNIKEVVTIAPKRAGSTTQLMCCTKIGNDWFVLTKRWKIILKDQLGQGPYKSDEMMVIPFTKQQNSWRFAFDLYPERDKPKGDDIDEIEWRTEREAETDKYTAAFEFFAKHMQIQVTGMRNPFLKGEPMYIMDFVNHRSINTCLSNDKKVAVYNKVNAMSLQEKLNLALYFMPSLYGKRHSEIKNELINLERGLLLSEAFIEQALSYDEKDMTVAMKTYVNKAIQMNIISQGQNGYYLLGKDFVGTNELEAVGHFLRDPNSYNNVVVPQVNKMQKLPEDDLVFVQEDLAKRLAVIRDYEKNKESDRGEWQAKYAKTIAEAKAMGIKNADNKTYTTLMDEMERIKRGDHKYISPERAEKNKVSVAPNMSIPPPPPPGSSIDKNDPDRLTKLKLRARELEIAGYGLYKDEDKLEAKIKEVEEKVGAVGTVS